MIRFEESFDFSEFQVINSTHRFHLNFGVEAIFNWSMKRLYAVVNCCNFQFEFWWINIVHTSNPRTDNQNVYSNYRTIILLRASISEGKIRVKIFEKLSCDAIMSKFHENGRRININVSKWIFSCQYKDSNKNVAYCLSLFRFTSSTLFLWKQKSVLNKSKLKHRSVNALTLFTNTSLSPKFLQTAPR